MFSKKFNTQFRITLKKEKKDFLFRFSSKKE